MLAQTLKDYGEIGVELLQQEVQKVSATGKTAASIRFEVTPTGLQLIGRGYFEALETGRGPRQGSTYENFDTSMLEYMNVRGIGAGLTQKKKEQLARFLTYRINRDGDKLWKQGHGEKVRDVYSKALDKFVDELTQAVKQDLVEASFNEVSGVWH